MSKILQVENLVQEFNLTKDFLDKVKFKNGHFSLENRVVHAVNNVSFDVEQGEVFSLVGESGCGKSTTARTIIKLIEPKSGKIIFDGRDITRLKPQEMRPIRREMQMIFQDPYASLNPPAEDHGDPHRSDAVPQAVQQQGGGTGEGDPSVGACWTQL